MTKQKSEFRPRIDTDVEDMLLKLSHATDISAERLVNTLLRCTLAGEFVQEVEPRKPLEIITDDGRKYVQTQRTRTKFRL